MSFASFDFWMPKGTSLCVCFGHKYLGFDWKHVTLGLFEPFEST
jgi:hypothetical protein